MDGITLFDMSSADPARRGFSGAVSDGRFIYFIPLNNGEFFGQVVRYDPQRAFDDPDAWSGFDSTQLDAGSRGFIDAVFDGRYLYLVPFCRGMHHGQVTRYDTRAAFDDPAGWSVFDTMTVHPHSRGFVSGCFDGRYLYLAPYQLDFTTHHGQITRYDTQAGFSDPAAWQVFDTASVHPDSRGFHSAVHAGNHVYFVPYFRGAKQYSGVLARLDRRLPFTSPEAWECFDLTSVDAGFKGFIGGAYRDGMLYLAPYMDGIDRHGRVVRFDTTAGLSDPQAWTGFDCAQVDAGSRGFFGAVCDSRYLYLVPHCRGVGMYHGQLTRLDLHGRFDDPASWSICDLGGIDPACRGFIGGALHGGKLYLAPFEIDAGKHSGLAVSLRLDQEAIWR